eukprot:NODE_18421_length_894_cov_2.177314.p7 GENE.NODE_18421_length_894_cov_2.177314~~NODE_18421_length_894_cov_2.177314.p7  ORF type:complete len:60 (+),score=15.01 NODE_18421_length_894_cov_2.177314:314-493(+)
MPTRTHARMPAANTRAGCAGGAGDRWRALAMFGCRPQAHTDVDRREPLAPHTQKSIAAA